MGKNTKDKVKKEFINKKVEKETYISKKKKIKVMFKNHTRVWGTTYQPRQVVEFDSIEGFERNITVIK